MKLLGRSFMVSAFLMISDFVSFIISLYLALGIFHANVDNFVVASSLQETGGWVALHWLLGL
ncbi:TPA: UDP-phosphate galactose phosphotransferase, partial [Klebsiella pneumoniae]